MLYNNFTIKRDYVRELVKSVAQRANFINSLSGENNNVLLRIKKYNCKVNMLLINNAVYSKWGLFVLEIYYKIGDLKALKLHKIIS